MKVLICANTAWNLVNFRSGLIQSLVTQGHEVVAVAPTDNYSASLASVGCRFVHLHIDSFSKNPLRDFSLLWRFWILLQRERPDVYLGYTIKPNIYGSIVAGWLGIPVVNNIAGLGTVFIQNGLLVRLVRCLYRFSLAHSVRIFFQNADDRDIFVSGGIVKLDKSDLLPGSGIDLARFQFSPKVKCDNLQPKFRFTLIARMLRDKGVREFVEASQIVKACLPQTECCLLGFVDGRNPTAISQAEILNWVKEGFVTYLGVSDDVRAEITSADCIVLPSYREGTPRSLLEACAIGRPVIATDTAGCREVVVSGHNGYLCEVGNAVDLAEKMIAMATLSDSDRLKLGRQGRTKVENEFDEKIVVLKYLAVLESIRLTHH